MTERSLMGLYEWANRLLEENPHGIGEALKEYAEAWERDTNGILRTSSNCNHNCTFYRQDDRLMFKPITNDYPGHRDEVLLRANRCVVNGVEKKYLSDVYHGWWDERDKVWVRWPHNFPPTHYAPIPDMEGTHIHVNNPDSEGDDCVKCGLDLRNPIHTRW